MGTVMARVGQIHECGPVGVASAASIAPDPRQTTAAYSADEWRGQRIQGGTAPSRHRLILHADRGGVCGSTTKPDRFAGEL